MANKNGKEESKERRKKLKELAVCGEILSDNEVNAFDQIGKQAAEKNISSDDEFDEEIYNNYRRLTQIPDIQEETRSLTRIELYFPPDVPFGSRSGTLHLKSRCFPPLSRGLQGVAVAVAAFATTAVLKPKCWNEAIIDQIVDDGDTYYTESYKDITINERTKLTLLDYRNDLIIRNSHRVLVIVDKPAFVGRFRSQDPRVLHLVKAFELFFKRYEAGILTSPCLNIAIWKDANHFYIFDGQARKKNCELAGKEERGAAKLILFQDMIGLYFIILEKSNVSNEKFVLYNINIVSAEKLPPGGCEEELKKPAGELKLWPSGYKIQSEFRAVLQGSYHLYHPVLPEKLQGRGDLVVALAVIIYSRLVETKKWKTPMLDLIFNQAHIYLIDLARVLGKKFDDTFDLKVEELISDVILGVYAAKIKVEVNVVPGQGKKDKETIETGICAFFKMNESGILEIKKVYYAIWKEGNKFYLLDPFACDEEGFRPDPPGPDDEARYKTAKACVTMNSSINELIETLLRNTDSKEKDPFIIHGIQVLYIKSGSKTNPSLNRVIYRKENTYRRPKPPPLPPLIIDDKCETVIDMVPRKRPPNEKFKNVKTEFPELMDNVEEFMMKDDEPTTFIVGEPDEVKDGKVVSKKLDEDPLREKVVNFIKGYKIVNPHRLILQGSKNCLAKEFEKSMRGRQGIVIALTAIAYEKLKETSQWRSIDVNQVIDVGHMAFENIMLWISRGSPAEKDEGEQEEGDNEDDDEEDDDDEEEEEEDTEGEEDNEDDNEEKKDENKAPNLISVPSNFELSMLPEKLKLGENFVTFKRKMNLVKGNANPLANLGEAFECYFKRHSELLIENKKLSYGIWKREGKYYVFNPYGSDEEGWRLRGHPASLAVTDTVNELTDLFHGILEFNDPVFCFHFVEIESIQPNNKYIASNPSEVDEDEKEEKYLTRLLPITDEDLFEPEPEPEIKEDEQVAEEVKEDKSDEDVDDEDEEQDDEEDEDVEEEDEGIDEDDKGIQVNVPEVIEKVIVDPLLEVEEQDQPDTPENLNLSLITGAVKIELHTENEQEKVNEDAEYERLKYCFPPPFVLPPKQTLEALLKAKEATRSVPSLLSRFSIDSKLATKEKCDLPGSQPTEMASIANLDSSEEGKMSRIIKLPPKKYLFSRIPPIGLTPIRAIDDDFIHNDDVNEQKEEECIRSKNVDRVSELVLKEDPKIPTGIRVTPKILPLGLVISTPILKKRKACSEKKKRECKISKKDKGDVILEKLLCNTENVLFEILFPKLKDEKNDNTNEEKEMKSETEAEVQETDEDVEDKQKLKVKYSNHNEGNKPVESEIVGFEKTEDEKIAIIKGNMFLENRAVMEDCHFKACYFVAILCIIAKITRNANSFRGSILDQLIIIGDKIYKRTGKLRYKPVRWFHNIEFLEIKCNVVLKQVQYADPGNWEEDVISKALSTYIQKNHTGILVFGNASYAFWFENNMYYLFDPYSCDENGRVNEKGFACLMKFCDLPSMIERIRENTGEAVQKPYRLYSLSVAHFELQKRQQIQQKCIKNKNCVETNNEIEDEDKEDQETEEEEKLIRTPEPSFSIIELSKWVTKDKKYEILFDRTMPGFTPLKNYNGSALEVPVVENDITRPEQAPFKKIKRKAGDHDKKILEGMVRLKPYNRKFKEHSYILEPIDLCVMGWACVHDPISWGVKTVKGLYEASKDYAFDSLLASEDSTVTEMTDGVLLEFNIANYSFRIVFAPLHEGKLYVTEGWNLAMSIKKVFETPIYTGAIIVCGKSHIGVMRKNANYYAWWAVQGTKNLRFITSEEMIDFLKLIVQEIDEPEEKKFLMRVVTISYARKLDPDCSDTTGLHETVEPATSLAEIHRKEGEPYDLEAIFRPTVLSSKPTFIFGTVALRNRESLKEPRVKRCYFVALLAVMVKRDIVQSPLPGMVDKVIEVGENLYKEFDSPKFHTEHILTNVTVMDRIFEFRDCASPLVELKEDPITGESNFFVVVRTELKKHFRTHTDGILHFTNCCYSFWYSISTNRYYYLDPYQCNKKGRKVSSGGRSCLFIFSKVCDMVQQMFLNKFKDTTGFFIHNLHVESVNELPSNKFQEDPIWVYLDYHWSFSHGLEIRKKKKGCKIKMQQIKRKDKPSWNHYVIEIPNLIYSVWGTIGSYDSRFGERAGKNQAAICVAILAMQNLSHPSQWGPSILDSAVICGDCFYTESLKSSVRNCCPHPNRFNLQTCFKVFPHIWSIDFKPNMCGILYGGRTGKPLAVILKLALKEAPNILIECANTVLAVCSSDDGFYAADSRWTGPPLHQKNHGSVYVLRCKNINSLVYALIKILNTNQRLEFYVTPVIFDFSQTDSRVGGNNKKKILLDPVRTTPGRTIQEWPLIPGAVTVPNEDNYQQYKRNLKLGLQYGKILENPPIQSPEPRISKDKLNNVLISTLWHSDVEKVIPKEYTRQIFDPSMVRHDSKKCQGARSGAMKVPGYISSITDMLERCDDYPRVIDFANDSDGTPPLLDKPVESLAQSSFILEESRRRFEKETKEMRDDKFKIYKHYIPNSREKENYENTNSEDGDDGSVEMEISDDGSDDTIAGDD
ncbi:uncharacterized protein LOC117176063 [Belonocnema kinseyi]|uniref:uncharacterized protein LOC117176063 n=1 Tax=Belonocnema kinseyi TaxID=2817044 RepID=UPI00143DD897|nr:uncharacterized protein LOC117176063 [Belonocnema kinseyi]XP_033221958.1 uncharacterized protein LOC117176063 [Belonocnema kinseyi]